MSGEAAKESPTHAYSKDAGLGAPAPAFDVASTVPPSNFLVAADGDEEKALIAWRETLQWRRENEIDKTLQTPQPTFKIIKRFYPWKFHGRDMRGNVCVYFRLGELRVAKLLSRLDQEKIHAHNVFYQEYMWSRVRTEQVTIIFDLEGLGFRDVSKEALGFIKAALTLQSKHYPAKTVKSFIVNAPVWFSYVFAVIKPFLNQRQREKVNILASSGTLAGLSDWIEAHAIPKEYGGSGAHALGECSIERELWDYVRNITESFDELNEGEDGDAAEQGQG